MVSRILAVALLTLVASAQATDRRSLTPRREAMQRRMAELYQAQHLPLLEPVVAPIPQILPFETEVDLHSRNQRLRRSPRIAALRRMQHRTTMATPTVLFPASPTDEQQETPNQGTRRIAERARRRLNFDN